MERGRFRTGRARPILLLLCDILFLAIAIVAAFRGYQMLGGYYSMRVVLETWPIFALMIATNICAKLYCGNLFYPGLAIHPVEELRRLTLSCIGSFLTFFALLTLTQKLTLEGRHFSRVALTTAMLLAVFLLPMGRMLLRYILRKFHWAYIPAVIAGDSAMAKKALSKMAEDRDCILEIRASGCGRELAPGLPNLTTGELLDFSRKNRISYLIYCNGDDNGDFVVENVLSEFLHVLVVNRTSRFPILWSYPVSFYRFFSFEVSNRLLHREVRIQKQLLEILFAALSLALLIVPMAVIALLVKLTSRGPILYRSRRLGQKGRPIEVLKFRTMRVDADRELEKLLEENPTLRDQWERNYKLDHDPRVTPLGAFLRRTSLDELPQFWNILKGEMALIGPRPIVPDEVRYYGDDYETFASVKPGITGLWQVSGRSDVDYEERVGLDVFYVNNWSFWMDCFIFFRTFFVILLGRGAY